MIMRVLKFRSIIPQGAMLVLALVLAVPFLGRAEAASGAIDPLSLGPLPWSEKTAAWSRRSLANSDLGTDAACSMTSTDFEPTIVPFDQVPRNICNGRTQQLIFVASRKMIVACHSQKAEFAMKVSFGSNGTGKTVQGDRKSPTGTYWIGYPRPSQLFGVFIPVGYPNAIEIEKGFTGSAIGIHGPMRFLKCSPVASLASNWTAGCLAMGRDSQVVTLSSWILDNWPVKITMTP